MEKYQAKKRKMTLLAVPLLTETLVTPNFTFSKVVQKVVHPNYEINYNALLINNEAFSCVCSTHNVYFNRSC